MTISKNVCFFQNEQKSDNIVLMGILSILIILYRLDGYLNPIQGGGQKRLRAPSSLNFDKNNHRMRL